MACDQLPKQLFLPEKLMDKLYFYIRETMGVTPRRKIIQQLVLDSLDHFITWQVYLSDEQEYGDFISTVFSVKTKRFTFLFSDSEWEKLQRIKKIHGLRVSNMMRFIFASLIYDRGPLALSVQHLIYHFVARNNKKEGCLWQYVVLMTKPVQNLLANRMDKWELDALSLMRAAHLYYISGIGSKPLSYDDDIAVVDNTKTGWVRVCIDGGIELKNYLAAEKIRTGKTVARIINNTVYSFLTESSLWDV